MDPYEHADYDEGFILSTCLPPAGRIPDGAKKAILSSATLQRSLFHLASSYSNGPVNQQKVLFYSDSSFAQFTLGHHEISLTLTVRMIAALERARPQPAHLMARALTQALACRLSLPDVKIRGEVEETMRLDSLTKGYMHALYALWDKYGRPHVERNDLYWGQSLLSLRRRADFASVLWDMPYRVCPDAKNMIKVIHHMRMHYEHNFMDNKEYRHPFFHLLRVTAYLMKGSLVNAMAATSDTRVGYSFYPEFTFGPRTRKGCLDGNVPRIPDSDKLDEERDLLRKKADAEQQHVYAGPYELWLVHVLVAYHSGRFDLMAELVEFRIQVDIIFCLRVHSIWTPKYGDKYSLPDFLDSLALQYQTIKNEAMKMESYVTSATHAFAPLWEQWSAHSETFIRTLLRDAQTYHSVSEQPGPKPDDIVVGLPARPAIEYLLTSAPMATILESKLMEAQFDFDNLQHMRAAFDRHAKYSWTADECHQILAHRLALALTRDYWGAPSDPPHSDQNGAGSSKIPIVDEEMIFEERDRLGDSYFVMSWHDMVTVMNEEAIPKTKARLQRTLDDLMDGASDCPGVILLRARVAELHEDFGTALLACTDLGYELCDEALVGRQLAAIEYHWATLGGIITDPHTLELFDVEKYVRALERRRANAEHTDHYKVLGVSRQANAQEIHRAYLRLARKHHPDRTNGDTELFAMVNEAHHILSDQGRRDDYDAALLIQEWKDWWYIHNYSVSDTASSVLGKLVKSYVWYEVVRAGLTVGAQLAQPPWGWGWPTLPKLF